MSAEAQTASTSPWIWVALIVTLGMTVWTASQEEPEDEVVAVTAPVRTRAPNNTATTSNDTAEQASAQNSLIDWASLDRKANQRPKDLFSAAQWRDPYQQRNKPVVAKAPPPPKAPPLPFSYMGRMDDGPSGNVIYLADQEQSYSVKAGGQVNLVWRLDSEDKDNLYFTYLPMQLTTRLSKN